jgi:hypothetical protein
MDTNETQTKPLDYRSILEAMEVQRAALDRAIAEMRVLAGVSAPQGGESAGHGSGSSVLSPGDVPAGAFHGKSIPEAAILFLRLMKQKQKTADIAAALKKGGIFSKAKPEKFNGQVHSIMDRATLKENAELVKMEGAYWALREWFPANVRASMASSGPQPKARRSKPSAKKHVAPMRPAGKSAPKTAKPSSQSIAARSVPAKPSRVPEKESTEGRILSTMYKNPGKEWTPAEVAEIAAIPRVQTVHFLLGKMAYRNLVSKTDNGSYTIRIPVQ